MTDNERHELAEGIAAIAKAGGKALHALVIMIELLAAGRPVVLPRRGTEDSHDHP